MKFRIPDDDLTSLKCSPFSNAICLGHAKTSFKVFDPEKQTIIFRDHSNNGRISTIEWIDNMIISGCKDEKIRFYDIRKRKPIQMDD